MRKIKSRLISVALFSFILILFPLISFSQTQEDAKTEIDTSERVSPLEEAPLSLDTARISPLSPASLVSDSLENSKDNSPPAISSDINSSKELPDSSFTPRFENQKNKIVLGSSLIKSQKGFFTVQVGSFTQEQPLHSFSDLESKGFFKKDNSYKYYSGNFPTKEAAAAYKQKLQEKGYSGAFVIYLPSSTADSTQITKSAENSPVSSIKTYTIRLAIYRDYVPVKQVSRLLAEKNIRFIKDDKGHTLVLLGKFSSYEEAEKKKKELVAKGYKEALIVEF